MGSERLLRVSAVAVGDLNGDNKPDVVFANRGEANQVFLNDGKGNFRDLVPEALAKVAGDTTCVALVDVDGDLDTDIVFGCNTNELCLVLNDGKAGFTDASARLPQIKEPRARAIAAGDIDRDGDVDLVIARFGKQNLLLLNDGRGTFTPVEDKAWPRDGDYTHCVAVGDVDLDGDLDVLFGNHKDPKGRGGDNTLLLGDGKGSFAPGELPKDRTSTSLLLLARVDGDPFPDLLQGILSERGGRTKQLENEGGTFRNRTHTHMPRGVLHVHCAVVADLDRDKDLDMVVGVRDAPPRLGTNDGTGKLSDATKGKLPEEVFPITALAAADADGDLDLIVANDGKANLLWRNRGDATFASDPKATSFLNKAEADDLARLLALQKELKFELPKQELVGNGRYRHRLGGRLTLDEAVAGTIEAGLVWLARHQDQDGSWDTDGFMEHDPVDKRCDGPGNGVHDIAVTGLALLAFLAEGNTPFTGPYRRQVDNGFAWLRKRQKPSGVFDGPNTDFIYAHCIATIAVCEGYGLSGDPRLEKAAQACRAGLDFGLKVNQDDLREALAWIHKVTHSGGRTGYTKRGESSSRHPGAHASRFPPKNGEAMTAVALLCRCARRCSESCSPISART